MMSSSFRSISECGIDNTGCGLCPVPHTPAVTNAFFLTWKCIINQVTVAGVQVQDNLYKALGIQLSK